MFENHFNSSLANLPGETWEEIAEYPGYFISNHKRIKSQRRAKSSIIAQRISVGNKKIQFKVTLRRNLNNPQHPSWFETTQFLVAEYPVSVLSQLKSDLSQDNHEDRRFIKSINLYSIPNYDDIEDFIKKTKDLPFIEEVKIFYWSSTEVRIRYRQINCHQFREYVDSRKKKGNIDKDLLTKLIDLCTFIRVNKIAAIYLD